MSHSARKRARPWRVGGTAIVALFVLGLSAPAGVASGNSDNGKNDASAGAAASSASDNGNAGGNSDGGQNGKGAENGNGADNGKAAWKQEDQAKPSDDSNDSAGGSTAEPETKGSSGNANEDNVPQPLSNADQNSGGANGQCPGGPYCSTDGEESKNGNGVGKAVGKPCAGCVGKADNKNPKGQMPNGSDHNKGYECDANKGIGRTNPAHTGCTTSPPPPPPPPPPCVPSKDNNYCKPSEPPPPPPPPGTPPTPETPPGTPPTPETPVKPETPETPEAPEEPSGPTPGEEEPEIAPGEGEVRGDEGARPRPAVVVAPAAAPTAAPVAGALPATGAAPLSGELALAGAGMLLVGSGILLRRRRT